MSEQRKWCSRIPSKDNIKSLAGIECKFKSKAELQELLKTNKDFLDAVTSLISVDNVSLEMKEAIDKEEELIKNEIAMATEADDIDETFEEEENVEG